ncbi:MAG: phosphohydrolase [Anaeromyxobacter sp.]
MFDRLTLAEDLLDCRGAVLARRGSVISPETIAEAGQRAPARPKVLLAETPLAADVAWALEAPVYHHLFARAGARDAIQRTLLAVLLPEPLVEELLSLRQHAPPFHRHPAITAAVAVRMLLTAVGEARALPELAAAALLHDVGMRHLPARLLASRERLSVEDGHRIAAHPLLGAYHLAAVLGHHPAVQAARGHHWRCGQGYPGLSGPPSRAIEVIGVASSFAALTQPRPYRSGAYDARGAADVLVREAMAARADGNTVKLLVHALRGASGDLRGLRFGTLRDGHAPDVNLYSRIEPPARSLI